MGKVKKASKDDRFHPHEILRQNLKRCSSKIITKDGKVKKKVAKIFTIFKCKFCKKKFDDKHSCLNHEKIHSTETFPCPQCPYQGKTKKYLSRHKKLAHSEPTRHKCSVCGKGFHFQTKLKEHVMVHTGEKPHKCDVCGKAFRVMFSLNGHKRIHNNEKPYKCTHCDYACRDNSTLRKHENRHLGIVKSFGCKLCTKKFPERAKLKYHISEVHLDYLELERKRLPCGRCDKTFKSNYHLNKHVQVVHDKTLACRCPICGRRVNNRYNLPAHLRTHFDERPYACSHLDCDKTFKDKSGLKKHSIIHQTRLHHACRTCGAKFSRAHRLTSHMRVHDTREKCIQCDYCGVSFYTKNYLIKHIKSKHCADKQKFICDHCHLVTYNKPSIVMHLKYGHCRNNHHRCKMCKTTYKRFEYLRSHYLKTHNIRYKPRKKSKRKEMKPSVQVKVEPMDSDEDAYEDNMTLLEVRKEEITETEDPVPEDDYIVYSKHVLSEDLAECILKNTSEEGKPENNFDEFLFKHVFSKQVLKEEEPIEDEVNEEQRIFVTDKIKEIISKAQETESAKILEKRRKKDAKIMKKKLRREAKVMRRKRRQEIMELMRVRQMYNDRMRAAAEEVKKKEPAKTIKYFQQKTTDKTCTDKQTDKTKTKNIDKITNNIENNDSRERNENSTVNDHVVEQNDSEQMNNNTPNEMKDYVNKEVNENAVDELGLSNKDKKTDHIMIDSRNNNGTNDLANDGGRNDSTHYDGRNITTNYDGRYDSTQDDVRNDLNRNYSRNDNGTNDSTNNHDRNDLTNNDGGNDTTNYDGRTDITNGNGINDLIVNDINDSSNYNGRLDSTNDDGRNDSANDNSINCLTNDLGINDSTYDNSRNDLANDSGINDSNHDGRNDTTINDGRNDSTNENGSNDSINEDGENDLANNVGNNDSTNYDGENDAINDKIASGKDSVNDDDKDDDSNDDKSEDDSDYEPNSDEEVTGNRKMRFKTHQCYICFKLYPTKQELIGHCQSHFDICNSTTLVKCPVCAHVASRNIAKHMLKKHQIQVKIPYNRITDRKDNTEGSRYCYKMDDTIMEIIPSVKILNHNAAIEIDKKNRERRNKTIAKTRLVKKGTEWIVENVALNISYEPLPEFSEQELNRLPVSDNYIDRLGQLNRLAKRRGIRMLFPCNDCDKICQNFSALKLHGRRHDPNKKPFAPKRYRKDAKPAPAKKKPEVSLENRLGKPQPITHKHKCDEKLKVFYETHIRGADIEFWQFLKIFNKMDRENIQDFKDFEGRTEFGIHTNEERANNHPKTAEISENTSLSIQTNEERTNNHPETAVVSGNTSFSVPKRTERSGTNSSKPNIKITENSLPTHKLRRINTKPYKRVIMISKKRHLEREKAKMRLRENLKQNG